ncbi:sulfurtransferase complex subunit TusB [Haliea sp.]
MLLHTVSRSPAHTALRDCVALLGPDDALLLLGDGVYAALAGSEAAALLDASGVTVFILEADAALAGIQGRLLPGATVVDDDGFVALTERYSRQLAWY